MWILASLMAPSIDSVPLAAKKEYWMSPGVICANKRASTPRSGSISSWLGMAVRFASFLVLAALMFVLRESLPIAYLAVGYLCTLLVLLFAETRFLT